MVDCWWSIDVSAGLLLCTTNFERFLSFMQLHVAINRSTHNIGSWFYHVMKKLSYTTQRDTDMWA